MTEKAAQPISTKSFDYHKLIDVLPKPIFLCTAKEFKILSANKMAYKEFSLLQENLSFSVETPIGLMAGEIFPELATPHKVISPSHPEGNERVIPFGNEYIWIGLFPIVDDQGYNHIAMKWDIVTETVLQKKMNHKLLTMLDSMPINIMMTNTDLTIEYVNKTSTETLKKLQAHLPISVEKLVGSSIDVFHKNPSHQRTLLADPRNLPHRAKIEVGDEILDLQVSAIMNQDGDYIGPMLNWSVATEVVQLADNFETNIATLVEQVMEAATHMQQSAAALTATSEETHVQSTSVSGASQELTSAITEISQQVTASTDIANQAVSAAEESDQLISGMSNAAQKIGEVVNIIQEIADQTNLLALNATIEAARAGESGKGFAVVAAEVKDLASQTSKATQDIAAQIDEIQKSTNLSVEAMRSIKEIIDKIAHISVAIAAAVEEQSAATQQVAQNIDGVSQASIEAGEVAGSVENAANELSTNANSLKTRVDGFIERVRAM